MGELSSALDGLAGEDLFGLTDAEWLDRVRELVAVQNRVAAELARTVRRAERAQAAERDGLKTMASGCAGTPGWCAPAGRWSTCRSWRRGSPPGGHRRADGRGRRRRRPRSVGRRRRSLTLVEHADGSVTGRFCLDAVGGEKLQTALESLSQANRPAGDARSRAQRQADALVQLADNALALGDLPLLRTVQPHVVLTVDVEDLVDPATAPGAAETGFGATLSAARARWTACDAQITRIVLDADGQPLDVGRTKRVVPAHLRRAVEHRDKHCGVVEMCRAPAATPPAIGARCIIWCIGPWAERPPWPTAGCSAKPTTRRSTTASGSNEIPPADGTPTAPTAPRSSCPHAA